MRKIIAASFLALLILGTGKLAVAGSTTTLTLTGTAGIYQNGIYVYPYDFTVATTGQPTLYSVPLLCDDFDDEVVFGESWKVTVSTGSAIVANGQMSVPATTAADPYPGQITPHDGESVRSKAYEDAAFLYALLGTGGDASMDKAINETIWAIFSTSTLSSYTLADLNVGAPTGSGSWFAYADNNSHPSDLNNVVLYTPIPCTESLLSSDQQAACEAALSSTNPYPDRSTRPQEFFGQGSAPRTPTPTPEPGTLILLGSGLMGLGVLGRRRRSIG